MFNYKSIEEKFVNKDILNAVILAVSQSITQNQ